MVSLKMPVHQPAELGLPFPDCGKLKNGSHMEAFFNYEGICRGMMDMIRKKTGGLKILDFGTGHYGMGRAVMEPNMKSGEELALYDPSADIANPIRSDRVHIVGEREAMLSGGVDFDMVNISYVLCHLEPEEARRILQDLVFAHPNAKFLVTDYVLKGRENLLVLLNAHEEEKWKKRMGSEEFDRTHSRFDAESLESVLVDGGLAHPGSQSWYLDRSGIRASMITEPDCRISY